MSEAYPVLFFITSCDTSSCKTDSASEVLFPITFTIAEMLIMSFSGSLTLSHRINHLSKEWNTVFLSTNGFCTLLLLCMEILSHICSLFSFFYTFHVEKCTAPRVQMPSQFGNIHFLALMLHIQCWSFPSGTGHAASLHNLFSHW